MDVRQSRSSRNPPLATPKKGRKFPIFLDFPATENEHSRLGPKNRLRSTKRPSLEARRPTMAAPVAAPERIGDLLVREGLITREQLDKALQEQKQNGTRVGYNLVKHGFVQETELTKMLARQFKMPAVDLSRFEVDPKIVKLIPGDIAIKNLVLPLK